VTSPVVETDDLCFAYRSGRALLSSISLSVGEGELCCLLGPNGAGKTTLLRCLLGLLRPERGVIRIAGHDLGSLSPRQLARLVAYVPQGTANAFPFTTLDIVVMGRTPHLPVTATPSRADRARARDVLEELGIGGLADQPFLQLSGGERQLALIGRALVQEAPLLVLDEPTSALDYGNAVRILRTVSEIVADGRTVVMTTHHPDHALAGAHRAVLLHDGRVVGDGPPRDVVTSGRLSELYGVSVHVVPAPVPGHPDLLTCIPSP